MSRWPHYPLVSLGSVTTGSTPATSQGDFYGGDLPFVTPVELGRVEPITQATRNLSEAGQRGARILPAGTVLVCCIGSLGKVGIAGCPLATNQQINAIVFDEERIHPRFGFFACRLLKSKMEMMAPATTIAIISKSKFEQLEIPVPPLPEQRRIAEVLDRAEALRAKRREALAGLDALTQAIFIEMFGDPATNPKGWEMSQVGNNSEVQGGLQVSSSRRTNPQEVPYLRVANVHRGFLNLSEIKYIRATDPEIRRTTLMKDDLLIVEGHGNPEEIGRCALWDGSIKECVHQNHIIRVRFNPMKVAPAFGCKYLNSPMGRRHLLRSGKTTSGLNTISVSDVRSTPIALPPLCWQQEFSNRAARVERMKATQRASLAELDALLASLQDRAFSGNL